MELQKTRSQPVAGKPIPTASGGPTGPSGRSFAPMQDTAFAGSFLPPSRLCRINITRQET